MHIKIYLYIQNIHWDLQVIRKANPEGISFPALSNCIPCVPGRLLHTSPPHTLTCTTGGRCSVVVGCTVVWAWDTCLMIVVGVTCRAIMGVPGAWGRGKKESTNTSVPRVKYRLLYLVFWFCIITNIKECIWATRKLWEGFSVLNFMQLSKSQCTYIHFFSLSLMFILGRRVVHINHIWSSLYQSFKLNEIQICKNIFDE